MSSEGRSDHSRHRAERFTLELPLLYRPSGETAWHAARTENLSSTGVLFVAHDAMQAGTQVEMSFAMPAQGSGEAGAEVYCQGEIVRTELPASTDASPRLAARILQYCFVREGKFVAT